MDKIIRLIAVLAPMVIEYIHARKNNAAPAPVPAALPEPAPAAVPVAAPGEPQPSA